MGTRNEHWQVQLSYNCCNIHVEPTLVFHVYIHFVPQPDLPDHFFLILMRSEAHGILYISWLEIVFTCCCNILQQDATRHGVSNGLLLVAWQGSPSTRFYHSMAIVCADRCTPLRHHSCLNNSQECLPENTRYKTHKSMQIRKNDEK